METIFRKIAVTERLPKIANENYLTISENGIETSRFFNGTRFETAHYDGEIVYWLEEVPFESNKKLQFKNDLNEIALEVKDKRINSLNFDLKCQKATSSTLRYCLGLLLILFFTSLYYNTKQLEVNRVLSTRNDSLISEIEFKEEILEKYRIWQSVKKDSSKKSINLFLRNEKILRLNALKN